MRGFTQRTSDYIHLLNWEYVAQQQKKATMPKEAISILEIHNSSCGLHKGNIFFVGYGIEKKEKRVAIKDRSNDIVRRSFNEKTIILYRTIAMAHCKEGLETIHFGLSGRGEHFRYLRSDLRSNICVCFENSFK